jgi:hypothetical protein
MMGDVSRGLCPGSPPRPDTGNKKSTAKSAADKIRMGRLLIPEGKRAGKEGWSGSANAGASHHRDGVRGNHVERFRPGLRIWRR